VSLTGTDLLLSRVDVSMLYPPFLVRLRAMLDEAWRSSKRSYWVVEGHRSYKRSDELFEQGRTKPGPVVTNAKAGQSAHNFGIAADLVRDSYLDRAGVQPDYRPESYELLGVLCPKHGLVWGGSWRFKDLPHVQLPGYVTALQLAPLRDAFARGGLSAAWRHVSEENTPLPKS
jgi:hypothetical protein